MDQQNELNRSEEEGVVQVMCLVCCRLKTVSAHLVRTQTGLPAPPPTG